MYKPQNEQNFPQDDEYSLQQGSACCVNLDIYYNCQFVQNETSSVDNGLKNESFYKPLEHTPIVAGTMTGTVYVNKTAIQVFVVAVSGVFTFSDLGYQDNVKAISGKLNLQTGEMSFQWNDPPGHNYTVVSYEYNLEIKSPLNSSRA